MTKMARKNQGSDSLSGLGWQDNRKRIIRMDGVQVLVQQYQQRNPQVYFPVRAHLHESDRAWRIYSDSITPQSHRLTRTEGLDQSETNPGRGVR